jgi:hypothetical protein
MQRYKHREWTGVEVIIIVLAMLFIGFHTGRWYENSHKREFVRLYQESRVLSDRISRARSVFQANELLSNRKVEFCRKHNPARFRAGETGVGMGY